MKLRTFLISLMVLSGTLTIHTSEEKKPTDDTKPEPTLYAAEGQDEMTDDDLPELEFVHHDSEDDDNLPELEYIDQPIQEDPQHREFTQPKSVSSEPLKQSESTQEAKKKKKKKKKPTTQTSDNNQYSGKDSTFICSTETRTQIDKMLTDLEQKIQKQPAHNKKKNKCTSNDQECIIANNLFLYSHLFSLLRQFHMTCKVLQQHYAPDLQFYLSTYELHEGDEKEIILPNNTVLKKPDVTNNEFTIHTIEGFRAFITLEWFSRKNFNLLEALKKLNRKNNSNSFTAQETKIIIDNTLYRTHSLTLSLLNFEMQLLLPILNEFENNKNVKFNNAPLLKKINTILIEIVQYINTKFLGQTRDPSLHDLHDMMKSTQSLFTCVDENIIKRFQAMYEQHSNNHSGRSMMLNFNHIGIIYFSDLIANKQYYFPQDKNKDYKQNFIIELIKVQLHLRDSEASKNIKQEILQAIRSFFTQYAPQELSTIKPFIEELEKAQLPKELNFNQQYFNNIQCDDNTALMRKKQKRKNRINKTRGKPKKYVDRSTSTTKTTTSTVTSEPTTGTKTTTATSTASSTTNAATNTTTSVPVTTTRTNTTTSSSSNQQYQNKDEDPEWSYQALLEDYHPRVLKWFDPQNTLKDPNAYHTIPLMVDDYLLDYGAMRPFTSSSRPGQQDTQFLLPAEIIEDDRTRSFAIISITVSSKDDVIYHRGFNKKSMREIWNLYGPQHHALIFTNTDDDDSTQVPQSTTSTVNYNTGRFIRDDFGSVQIEDTLNNRTIILFKINN